MEFAWNTIILFLLFLVPGLIFRRFYYTAEFSKQYFKASPAHVIGSSLLPGLIAHLLFLTIWHNVYRNLEYDVIIQTLFQNFSTEITAATFDKNTLKDIIFYNGMLWICVAATAYLLRIFVRISKLDRSIKILRFQNEWQYILRGEILDFPVMKTHRKSGKMVLQRIEALQIFHETQVVYHGILADYVLTKEGNSLDRIYLADTVRFDNHNATIRPIEYNLITRNLLKNGPLRDVFLKNLNIHSQIVDGTFMVIPYSKVENLNIRYVYRKDKPYRFRRWIIEITKVIRLLSILFIWTYDFFIVIPWLADHENRISLKWMCTLTMLFLTAIPLDMQQSKTSKEQALHRKLNLFTLMAIIITTTIIIYL